MSLAPAPGSSWTAPHHDGPAWLNERRSAAAVRYGQATLPTERDEDFRYGRIDDLDLTAFGPLESADEGASSAQSSGGLRESVGATIATVRVTNGTVTSIETDGLPAGVVISAASALAEAPAGFGELLAGVEEPFGDLATALTPDAVVVTVAPGTVVTEPLLILHELGGAADHVAAAPRTFIALGEAAQLSVIEQFVSSEAVALYLPVTELDVAAGANLAYHAVQQLGSRAWQLGYQLSRVARDGVLRSFTAALGGEYARLYTRSDLLGEGAESRLLATYLARNDQVQDLRTFQEHAVGRTTSDLVFKGAVADRARSVYTGLIHIAKGARRSNAAQSNRNLVLSEGAHADSVPNLDIEENDVRCSHASAVGPIDPEQRFYLESRGLPTEVAERLILLGFFDDLFDDVPDAGCGDYLRGLFAAGVESVQP